MAGINECEYQVLNNLGYGTCKEIKETKEGREMTVCCNNILLKEIDYGQDRRISKDIKVGDTVRLFLLGNDTAEWQKSRPVGDEEFLYNFEATLRELKREANMKAYRTNWNGKGMYIEAQFQTDKSKMTSPYLVLVISNKPRSEQFNEKDVIKRIPWTPSQTDIFAKDWIFYI